MGNSMESYRHAIGVFNCCKTIKCRKLFPKHNYDSSHRSFHMVFLYFTFILLVYATIWTISFIIYTYACNDLRDNYDINEFKLNISNYSKEIIFTNCESGYNCHLFGSIFINKYMKATNGNINKKDGYTILHLNIRSIRHKSTEVESIIFKHSPHFFGLSEVNLNSSRDNLDDYKIENYETICPLSWHSRGIARALVYIKSNIRHKVRYDLSNDYLQSIWIEVSDHKKKKLIYCFYYREFKTCIDISENVPISIQCQHFDVFLNQWQKALYNNGSSTVPEVSIFGDFNLDLHKWTNSSYPYIHFCNNLSNFITCESTCQLVPNNAYTWFMMYWPANGSDPYICKSCIDLIFSNNHEKYSPVEIIDVGCSDHNLLKIKRFTKKVPVHVNNVLKRSYKNFNSSSFLSDISSIDWSDIYQSTDVNHCVDIFTSKFTTVLNSHAPLKVYQSRKNYAPWLSNSTKEKMKIRDNLLKAARLSNSSATYSEYKRVRNEVNRLQYTDKHYYERNKIQHATHERNSKKLWKFVKNTINWFPQNTLTSLIINNCIISKSIEVAEIMNKFFIEKIINLVNDIPNNSNDPNSYLYSFMHNRNVSFNFSSINISKVLSTIGNLKNSNSFGFDKISTNDLKLAKYYVAPPLTYIYNLCLTCNDFPDLWKRHCVLPYYKKGDKYTPKNYRPIAILCSASKPLEKLMHEQLFKYFDTNSLLCTEQYGFVPNHSTTTSVISIYDHCTLACDSGSRTGLLLLDYSSAFDTIDHSLLLKKLGLYGLNINALNLIKSYLINRQQCTQIGASFSSWQNIIYGVPQGSILGPLLFTIFINEFPLLLKHCSVRLYADDCTILFSSKLPNVITSKIQEDFTSIELWCHSNRLCLNPEKIKFMECATQQSLNCTGASINDISIKFINGTDVQLSNCEKILGVNLSNNLSFIKHLDGIKERDDIPSLLNKLAKRLTYLKKIRSISSFETTLNLANGIFMSVLIYGIPAWGGLPSSHINKLQLILNKAARIILKVNPFYNSTDALKRCKWFSISDIIKYHSIVLIFKILKTSKPQHIFSRITSYSPHLIHNNSPLPYITRSITNRLITPHPVRLNITKNSFIHRTIPHWNALPLSIRSSSSPQIFKSRLKSYMNSNYNGDIT